MMQTPPHTLADRARALEGDLPEAARTGRYALGTTIMVSRESLHEDIRNPLLPEWFPAAVVLPPESEPGNWYRWYDPFIWYETEVDLSNGGEWCTEKRNTAYVGKLWSRDDWEFWAIPAEQFNPVVAARSDRSGS